MNQDDIQHINQLFFLRKYAGCGEVKFLFSQLLVAQGTIDKSHIRDIREPQWNWDPKGLQLNTMVN